MQTVAEMLDKCRELATAAVLILSCAPFGAIAAPIGASAAPQQGPPPYVLCEVCAKVRRRRPPKRPKARRRCVHQKARIPGLLFERAA